ncbi:IclR family transcriptional regulator [Paenibacillus sp. y28]|uniref:IclR family transcriptional regulator n=1 Tax=Paenibacillus sp. y28 TaxID=3129110 RepID=UPI003018BEB6
MKPDQNEAVRSVESVESVERALEILDCFSRSAQELSVSDLAERLKLPESAISPLLSTLRSKHYIERDTRTDRYQLGSRLYDLGHVYAAGMDLRKLALPFMRTLNSKTSEAVSLNIVDRGERVCIEKLESLYPACSLVQAGERSSLCRGASGNVLLAFMPEEEARQIIRQEDMASEQQAALLEALRRIRSNGYSMTVGHRMKGVIGFSAPVFGAAEQLAAGLSISGPVERLAAKKESLLKELTLTASLLSARLGEGNQNRRR